ncbi:Mitochondrial ATPase complex subunit atp10 [Coemansia sp. RSA 2322]|uniref:Mitochondrial ATPase complex subunit atp10 n=1 Tax=Coemansia thaxteri TaxID=2663907 RepID=A0A9W8EH75_9FUNG|nr:Mitochondrial ATPase complex subunit atp10 [Coemansia thaxteri]KAJ2469649.1 Mitochondrial ATPase complex subunit atp10 [Coemansia sp. RSA 2322]KAJ2474818.1 Mitochondrial ATPase complex subunit atp10 [Coemansia sp. RSA 2320]
MHTPLVKSLRLQSLSLLRPHYASRLLSSKSTAQPEAGESASTSAAASPSAGDKHPLPEQAPKANEPEQEKIEYIGNTRFPRPRPKPRRTITPGDAVGLDAPAGKVEHTPIKVQLEQKMRDVLSPEKNLESRAKIIREIGESYFQNILDLRNNGDKLFEAPAALIPAAKAKFLPNLEGKTLAGANVDIVDMCRGKTTLLTVEFVKFAEKHTQSYINVFEASFADSANAQVIQINIEENWAKAAVLKMCLPYVRRAIPKHRHSTYVVHYGGVEALRNSLGIANPLIGYAFLVDTNTRVRWYANGEAVQSEGISMVSLTHELLRKAK